MTTNKCLKCESIAYDTALEGLAEILVDDDVADDMDTAVHLIRMSNEHSLAVIEETKRMLLDDPGCEEWHA